MLSSLARYLEPLPDEEGDVFLTQIQSLFQSDFIAKQQLCQQEETDSLNTSPRAGDLADLGYDQLISEEGGADSDPDSGRASEHRAQATDSTSETDSSTVLHLGSVLSSEHDYLL